MPGAAKAPGTPSVPGAFPALVPLARRGDNAGQPSRVFACRVPAPAAPGPINDCTPTCVGGTFHKFPVITVLWRVRPRPHHSGQMMLTRATIIYTGTIPAGFHRTRTIPLFG